MTKLISRFREFFLALKCEPRKKTPPAESDCKRDYDGNNCVHWSLRNLRTLRPIFGVCLGVLFCAGLAHATTYYIATSGVDSNNGTSETTPWLHAPGMPSCSSSCLAEANGTGGYTAPSAGDSFIFRGGDTWHVSNTSAPTYMGGTWVWRWSGSSANCNYPTVVTSCIYIGTDPTWYSGASFTRPALDFDNPLSTSLVTSCAYPDATAVNIGNSTYRNINYVIFDDFELYGKCISSTNPASWMNSWGIYHTYKDLYFHGWTEESGINTQCCEDGAIMMNESSVQETGVSGQTHNVVSYVVADGSDSYCTGDGTCSGGPMLAQDAYEIDHSVCRYMTNCLAFGVYNFTAAHDNLFDHDYGSWDTNTHSNVIEMQGSEVGVSPEIYNNTFSNISIGIILDLYSEPSMYIFNNVFYGIKHGANCLMIENNLTPGGTVYFSNNTVDQTVGDICEFRAQPNSGYGWDGTVYEQNNHLINITSMSQMETCSPNGSTCVWTDLGNEIFQTETVANGQGYTEANGYQPTSTSGATYHAGGNLSTSCTTYSSDSALCNGSTGGVTNTAGSGAVPALYIASPPARGTTFDSGAYQFSGVAPSTPVAPAPWFAELTSLPFRVWL